MYSSQSVFNIKSKRENLTITSIITDISVTSIYKTKMMQQQVFAQF
jgi:hypothetical protein